MTFLLKKQDIGSPGVVLAPEYSGIFTFANGGENNRNKLS